jgi:2-dehydropantoate 2-reductase
MRFVVLGAGGLGLLLSAFLSRAGHSVVLACRDETAAVLQRQRISVTGLSSFEVSVAAASRPGEIEAADYLLVVVKTPDTAAALDRVDGIDFRGVLSLQNGVAKDEVLAARFGQGRVIGACTMLGATRGSPTEVIHTLSGITYLGELDGSVSCRVQDLASAFNEAGMKAEIPEGVLSAEWSKLCRIVPGGLRSALSRLEFYRINKNSDLAWLLVAITRECAAVARAAGVEVQDYEGLAIRTLADASVEDAVASVVERGLRMERSGQTKAKISMLQDVLQGRRTEVEDTVGYVVRRARELGVAVPNVEFGYRVVRGIEAQFEPALVQGATPST